MTDLHDAIVVGAGISGLVVAHRLQRLGWRVGVAEAAPRAGGVIGSITAADGALYETGPNSALETHAQIGALVDEIGLRSRWVYASAAAERRYIVRGGRLQDLPTTPAAFLATRLFSWRAKLALAAEPLHRRADAAVDESIAAFVRRRLGAEFLDYAIDPFVAGVYAGDPERISVRAAFPKLHALEQRWGSLIVGQVRGARERARSGEAAKNAARSFSFDGGMQLLTDALAARLPGLVLGARVTSIRRDADGFWTLQALQSRRDDEPRAWRARAIVLATPAAAAAELLAPLAPDAAAALRAIPYAPVASVASLYDRAAVGHALDGFGCLVPRKESRRLLGVLFSSAMYAGRAGPDGTLLTSFVGGRRQGELLQLDDAALAALVHDEHRALLGAAAAPRWQAVTRWERAIPQYEIGHLERVARAAAAATALPGLAFCANWGGGVAVGDCIRNGEAQAQATALYLKQGALG
ncbi:MAG: protoporphyrinogen oxidase [Burkholderiales bacterium]|nr:protoporphyrinogen oxidase [Burkholderiales bacterium]